MYVSIPGVFTGLKVPCLVLHPLYFSCRWDRETGKTNIFRRWGRQWPEAISFHPAVLPLMGNWGLRIAQVAFSNSIVSNRGEIISCWQLHFDTHCSCWVRNLWKTPNNNFFWLYMIWDPSFSHHLKGNTTNYRVGDTLCLKYGLLCINYQFGMCVFLFILFFYLKKTQFNYFKLFIHIHINKLGDIPTRTAV